MTEPGPPGRGTGARRTPAGLALGWAFIVAGGLTAAVTGPLELTKGSWLAAYLVLVCGVGTYAATRRDAGSTGTAPRRLTISRAVCWLTGNAAVVTGALTGTPLAVDLGAVALLAGFVVALILDVRVADSRRPDRWVVGYRALLVVFIVSAPIGAVLSHLRAG